MNISHITNSWETHLDPNETNSGTPTKTRVRHVSVLVSSRPSGHHAILLRCLRSIRETGLLLDHRRLLFGQNLTWREISKLKFLSLPRFLNSNINFIFPEVKSAHRGLGLLPSRQRLGLSRWVTADSVACVAGVRRERRGKNERAKRVMEGVSMRDPPALILTLPSLSTACHAGYRQRENIYVFG